MKLFDKEDILTPLTADKAMIDEEGYFGNTLKDIKDSVECGEVYSLVKICGEDFALYPFESNHRGYRFVMFLPKDKVKEQTSFRPLRSIDELFDFLMPDFNKDNVYDSNGNKIKVDTNKKAEYLLGRKITLKGSDNQIKVTLIQDVDFHSDDLDSNNIYLNYLSLEYLFQNFKIQKDGKFVSFGVVE